MVPRSRWYIFSRDSVANWDSTRLSYSAGALANRNRSLRDAPYLRCICHRLSSLVAGPIIERL